METLPRFGISRTDMMKRVARFNELKAMVGFPIARRRDASASSIMSLAFNRPKTRVAL